jgi:hypothetical protein
VEDMGIESTPTKIEIITNMIPGKVRRKNTKNVLLTGFFKKGHSALKPA